MKSVLVLKNPGAGTKIQEKDYQIFLKGLEERKIQYTVDESLYPGYFGDKYGDVKELDYSLITICGGDGTLHEAVNATIHLNIPYALFPMGSGNDFYKNFYDEVDGNGLSYRIFMEKFREVDVIKVNDRYSLNSIGVGLDVLTLQIHKKLKKIMWGKLPYKVAALASFLSYDALNLEILVDDVKIDGHFPLAVVASGKYFGGNMVISPESVTNDGLLELIVLKEVSKKKLLSLFKRMMKGQHLDDTKVIHLKGKKIEIRSDEEHIYQAEGELVGKLPIVCQVLPKRIKLIV